MSHLKDQPPESHPRIPELHQLSPSESPSPDLEEQLVERLRERNLLRHRAKDDRGRTPVSWLVAACLVAAVGGWMARGWIGADGLDRGATDSPIGASALTEAPQPPEEEYLLLLVEPRPLRTSKSIAVLVDEYRAWAAQVADRGRLVSAGHLQPGGPYLAEASGEPPGIGAVTGFFVVRAGSLEEARRLAATCPHRAYGGEISVRPLAGTSGPPAI